VAALLQDRLRTLSDAPQLTDFFFAERLEYDPSMLVQKGVTAEQTAVALARAAEAAEHVDPFAPEQLEPAYRALAEEVGLKTSQLFMSMRVACTGKTATPPLFETMAVLGRDTVASRLREGAARLS